MDVEMWPIENIKLHEHDALLRPPGVDALAEAIRYFGFRQPLVVDADGVVLSGEAGLWAARDLGMQSVPVHVARDLTPERCRAYRIAARAVAGHWAGAGAVGWEAGRLEAELEGLSEASVEVLDGLCVEVQSALDGPYPYFGWCAECGGGRNCNIERAHWGYCDKHRTRWFAGSNVFSDWRNETEEQWRSRWERIGAYREVKGVFPTQESEAKRKLARRPWLTRDRAAVPEAAGAD